MHYYYNIYPYVDDNAQYKQLNAHNLCACLSYTVQNLISIEINLKRFLLA